MMTLNHRPDLASLTNRCRNAAAAGCAIAVVFVAAGCQSAHPPVQEQASASAQTPAQIETEFVVEDPAIAPVPSESVGSIPIPEPAADVASQPEPPVAQAPADNPVPAPAAAQPSAPQPAAEPPAQAPQAPAAQTAPQQAAQTAPTADPATAALADALQQALLQSQANAGAGAPTQSVEVDLSTLNVDVATIQQMVGQMSQINFPGAQQGTTDLTPTTVPR
jgi:hypothetical protein